MSNACPLPYSLRCPRQVAVVQERHSQVIALWSEGMSNAAIALACNVSKETVRRHLRRDGIAPLPIRKICP